MRRVAEDYATLSLELRLLALCLPPTKVAAAAGHATGRRRASGAGDWDDIRLGPSPKVAYDRGMQAKNAPKRPRFKPIEAMRKQDRRVAQKAWSGKACRAQPGGIGSPSSRRPQGRG